MSHSGQNAEIIISANRHKLDIEFIFNFLTNSYWAKGRTRNEVEKTIEHSLCFGIYINHKQIGFARVVTDYITFAYLMDVFVIEEFRGQGYGKQLIEYILNYPDMSTIKKWLLSTTEAQKLYVQFGFAHLKNPEKLMEMIPAKI